MRTVKLDDVYHVIAGHSNYHGDSILTALTCLAEGKQVNNIRPIDAVSKGVYDQVRWERDVAIAQLEELGIGFGQKKPDIDVVQLAKFEMFDRITSVWYGKRIFFMQDDGMVYSKIDCDMITFDQAVDEFCSILSEVVEMDKNE